MKIKSDNVKASLTIIFAIICIKNIKGINK